jgi:outer membrane protein
MMRNCFRYLSLAAALLVGAAPAVAQTQPIINDSLSLEGTLRSVLEANPGLTQLDELVAQADARLAQTRTGLLPLVTGTATYTRLDPVAKVNFPGADGQVRELAFVPNNNYDAHITAQYLLYDFGQNRARIALTESQRVSAQNNVAAGRRDLAYAAVQSYYAILLMRQSVAVAKEQVTSLQAHQREVEKRVIGGIATKFDVSQTKVRIAQAENLRLDLENQLRQQEIQLARLLHRPDGGTVPVRGRLTYAPLQPNEPTLVQRAIDQRIEMKQARDARQTADLSRQLQDRIGKPTLGIGAQVGAKNGYQPDIQQIRPNFTGVVQLSVPIYDGSKTRNQRVEAQAGVRAADARILDVQEQVRADVRSAISEIQSQSARYDNALVQINEASDALTRARARQRAEVGSNLDVLDAETALAQARLSQLQATYGYLLGQYKLKRAVGDEIQ